MLVRQKNSLLRAASQNRGEEKDHGPVAVPHVPFSALDVTLAGYLLQLIAAIKGAILGQPALRAPAAVRDAMLNREIKRGPVGVGLAAGNDFLKHSDGLHWALAGVETEVWLKA